MINEKLIRNIEGTEKKAAKILEKGASTKERLIAQARSDALKLINDRQESLSRKRDEILQQVLRELADEKLRIIAEYEAKMAQVHGKAVKNMAKAVSFVVDEFKRSL